MRFGLHSSPVNLGDNVEVAPLVHALKARGHKLVVLNTDDAAMENGKLVFPGFGRDSKLDTFVSYLPYNDINKLWHGSEPNEVPYFTQVKLLSHDVPSPTSYKTQLITNSKTQMAKVFAEAGVPIPKTWDGSDPAHQEEILDAIAAGKTMVFKPDMGASGDGIIKTASIEDARESFLKYGEEGWSFPVQEYISGVRDDGVTHDYRAFVVGDTAIAGIRRTTKKDEWRGNQALGATLEPFELTPAQKADAVKAMKSAALGFGSVDILIDARSGQHYICEINDCLSMGHLRNTHPHIDLPGEVARMLENTYGVPADSSLDARKTPASQTATSAKNPSTPGGGMKPA